MRPGVKNIPTGSKLSFDNNQLLCDESTEWRLSKCRAVSGVLCLGKVPSSLCPFWGICSRHFSFGRLSGVFERLCGLVAVTAGLTLFTSSLVEVSGFKCSYTSLQGLWSGAVTLPFCIWYGLRNGRSPLSIIQRQLSHSKEEHNRLTGNTSLHHKAAGMDSSLSSG